MTYRDRRGISERFNRLENGCLIVSGSALENGTSLVGGNKVENSHALASKR